MADATGRAAERPLSPHLQIYSPLINMVMSIVHRITGTALYFGTLGGDRGTPDPGRSREAA